MSLSTRILAVTAGAALAACAVLIVWLNWDALLCWLIAISAVTFLAYGYDKAAAVTDCLRIPERTLLTLAFVGGTPGALLGMWVFHHKTIKKEFQVRFWLVAAIQVLLVAVYFLVVRR